MSQTNRIASLILTSIDATTIAIDTWTPFDIDGLENPCVFLCVTNMCSHNVFISYDGVNRHEIVTPWDKVVINFQTNSSPGGYVSKVKKNNVLYIQGTADQKGGDIYLSGYYNEVL